MRNRLLPVLVTTLLGAGGVLAADAVGEEPGVPDCTSGVLAADPAGDGTYAGLTGTGLESSSGDILSVSTNLGAEDATGPGSDKGLQRSGDRRTVPTRPDAQDESPAEPVFTMAVADLGPTDPHHFDLLVRLNLVTEAGRAIVVDARRSTLSGETATVDGSSEGASAVFDEEADEIRVTVPAAAFEGVNTLSLQLAQTRYDTGAVLSPLADEAAGACAVVLNPDYVAPAVEDHAGLDTSILVIDTGVNGHHPEFADGQISAWWDFSSYTHLAHGAPAGDPGTSTWFDTDRDGVLHGDRDDPYDPQGHGSAVSSMAAGSNAFSPAKTPSACPGCSFAVAKVQDESADSLNGSIASAIRWGVDVLEVDVITVSIGAIAPVPAALLQSTYSAAEHARQQGVLVVFANGNGWGNAGIPGQPGGFMPYGNSPHVLSVGADDLDSFLVTTDPEVVAVFSVHAAQGTGSGYRDISGTSFSAPFTAGVAARIIGEGRACGAGYDVGADSIEQLLKYTAADRPEVPPTFEGYGVVTLETMAHAVEVACGRADLPAPDSFNDFYVTNVSGTQRELATTSPAGLGGMTRTPFTDVTGPLEIGPSSPTGPKDAEIYTATVPAGATFTMVATGTGDLADVNDFDMVLYQGVSDTYDGPELASSGNGGSTSESVTWENATGGDVVVSAVVYGWAVGENQPFDLTTSHSVELDFDGYVLADNLLL